MIIDKSAFGQELAKIINDNVGNRLTVALGTGIFQQVTAALDSCIQEVEPVPVVDLQAPIVDQQVQEA